MMKESSLGQRLTKGIQRVLWVYLRNNYYITAASDFDMLQPMIPCDFIPITQDNYSRVRDFRDETRVVEYYKKLSQEEIGFFAESEGKTVGSIWATVNLAGRAALARGYIILNPNEALIHDVVAGQHIRGKGVGPFMVASMASILLMRYRASKIIIDVSIRNKPSLSMMSKIGLEIKEQSLYVSALNRFVIEKLIFRSGHS